MIRNFAYNVWNFLAWLNVLIFAKMSAGLATMSDAEQPIPEIYREAAEQVRQLAQVARLTDIRGDLLELAARFERMAAYADAAIRLDLPGYPHGELIPIGCHPSRSGSGSEEQ